MRSLTLIYLIHESFHRGSSRILDENLSDTQRTSSLLVEVNTFGGPIGEVNYGEFLASLTI